MVKQCGFFIKQWAASLQTTSLGSAGRMGFSKARVRCELSPLCWPHLGSSLVLQQANGCLSQTVGCELFRQLPNSPLSQTADCERIVDFCTHLVHGSLSEVVVRGEGQTSDLLNVSYVLRTPHQLTHSCRVRNNSSKQVPLNISLFLYKVSVHLFIMKGTFYVYKAFSSNCCILA